VAFPPRRTHASCPALLLPPPLKALQAQSGSQGQGRTLRANGPDRHTPRSWDPEKTLIINDIVYILNLPTVKILFGKITQKMALEYKELLPFSFNFRIINEP
jgi:hypothetical protein